MHKTNYKSAKKCNLLLFLVLPTVWWRQKIYKGHTHYC